jgi:FtsP/CotA-like multicopper oxidase with cupredoxin domain
VFAQPIDYFLAVWFSLAALSTAYVAWDQLRHNPEPVVMKWGFILVTLYLGPLGLLLYVMADKEPAPGEHEEFIKPLWKQGVGSTMHCVAGDATGIILAAVVTAVLGLPMWIDLIVEYAAGFAFGLFIFQSLFMKKMMGGSYWENVRKSFMPEFISMNAMMAGMAPVMALLMMGRDMRAMDPTELLFWGVMSLGVAVGFAVAYPVNVWMVSRKMKHGLMTERRSNPAPEAQPNARAVPEHAKAQDSMPLAASAGTARHETHGEHGQSAHGGDAHGGHGGHSMQPNVTRPQLAAVTLATTLMLLAGVTMPAMFVNMHLSNRDVLGAIMPPSMIMGWDTPGDAMRDMSAIHPRLVTQAAAAQARGDVDLVPTMDNGVKVFNLETSVIRWNILPDVTVEGYAFNATIPGPRIRVTEGDRVRIKVTNRLPESTTVHWHGLILPNEMDGPAKITQQPIRPGGSYTYEFTTEQAGTFFYHSHDHVDRQQAFGLYGALIIDPKNAEQVPKADHEYVIQLQEWLKREGLTYPAMLMEGGLPNYFTINGKAFPATDTVTMKVGETIKLRFVGSNNNFVHPMHVHGGPFTVVARDGYVLPESARFQADTVNVGPGQRYDVIWKALRPGKWLVHCHIPHHTTNNNVEQDGGGGLMMVLEVEA